MKKNKNVIIRYAKRIDFFKLNKSTCINSSITLIIMYLLNISITKIEGGCFIGLVLILNALVQIIENKNTAVKQR